jgi:hypothetical protein
MIRGKRNELRQTEDCRRQNVMLQIENRFEAVQMTICCRFETVLG